MRELVALDLPGGPAFVDALRRAWDRGDAVLPVDQRLPAPARSQLLATARPHTVVLATSADPIAVEPGAPLLDEGDALVVASSGSTGTPKLVVHTHDGIAAHARAVHQHLAVDPATDRWLACLPLAHLGGLGVVLRSLATDTPVDVLPGFDAQEVAAAPRRLGTTLVSLVPTALGRVDPAPFRWVVLGGSADLVDRPPNVVRTYGLTETGGGVAYDGLPLPGVEVRVDVGGAISISGPTLARGVRLPDGQVIAVADDHGWLDTGDLGTWAPDGRLEVHGRADDLIVTGGENVWPAAVEAAIATHPAVGEVVVAGRPDAEWGQVVVAVVVPADGHELPSLDELRAHVRTLLPAFAAPRHLRSVHALPRTALGKVRRAGLVDPDDPQ